MIQTATTTEQIVGDFLEYAYPLWVTVYEIADEITPVRAERSINDALNRMIENQTATRRVRNTPRAPYEYRKEATPCNDTN